MNRPVIGVGTLNVSRRARELVLEALDNNRLSYGPMMQRFETEFASLHGCRFGIMSNSGTSALQVALQALKEIHGWQDGDEVLIPAVTFVATANIVWHNRMRPVPVDVEPTYYELDPTLIEAKITGRTRAIIPVHLFGQPADMDPIAEIADRHGLKIIEDSAETMFSTYRGRRVGGLGHIGCFSTYVAHLLVTGVGGISITDNPDYAVAMRSLINHGRDSIYISIDDDKDRSTEELRLVVARRFKFVSVGHSFRVTELEAALGLAQLEQWEALIAARRANARSLIHRLAHFESYLQLPKIRPGCEHSFMMFPLVLRNEPKEELVNFLEQNGVETRDMLPLTNQPVYHRLFGWREEDYPVAHWINQNGFYIGCHQELSEFDLDYMAELFERYFRQQPAREERTRSALVITGSDQAAFAEAMDVIPMELFDQLVVVNAGLAPEEAARLDDRGVMVVPLAGADAFHMLVQGKLAVSQDNLVLFKADGRQDPRDVGRLLLALERGHDMVVASRFIVGGERRRPGQMSRYRSIGNRVFSLLANLLFYGNLSDCLSQFRAVKRSRLAELNLAGKGLPLYYRLSIQAIKRGWRLAEIPTTEFVRPELDNYRRILKSIIPVFSVLVSEWLFRRSD